MSYDKKPTGFIAILLLVFVVVSVVIITASIGISITQTSSVVTSEIGMEAHIVAESGAENALLRLLRDPTYLGETLSVGDGTATVTVTGNNPQIIRSIGQINTQQKIIEVRVDRTSGVLDIISWDEVYE